LRKSGFLIPEFADTSVKGVVLGDGYYWAPRDWTDLSLGGAYLSKRGWQQNGEFRAKPWEKCDGSANISASSTAGCPYHRGECPGKSGAQFLRQETALESQGGHSDQFDFDAQLHRRLAGRCRISINSPRRFFCWHSRRRLAKR
jgi:hypothetical protein